MGFKDWKLVGLFTGAKSQDSAEAPVIEQAAEPKEIDPANPTSIEQVSMFRSHLIRIKDAPGYTHMMVLLAPLKFGFESDGQEKPLLRQTNIMVKGDGKFEFVDQFPGMDLIVGNILDGCAHLQAWEEEHGPDFDDAYLNELNERKKAENNQSDALIPPHHSVVSELVRAAGMTETPAAPAPA